MTPSEQQRFDDAFETIESDAKASPTIGMIRCIARMFWVLGKIESAADARMERLKQQDDERRDK